MVVPAIIKAQSSSSDSSQVDVVVSRILHVFVDALPHVPDHRRVPVLVQVLTTVGPERFLWVLLGLLFSKQATTSTTSTTTTSTGSTGTSAAAENKDSALERDWDLWVSVCCEFGVKVQIQSWSRSWFSCRSFSRQRRSSRQTSRRSQSRRYRCRAPRAAPHQVPERVLLRSPAGLAALRAPGSEFGGKWSNRRRSAAATAETSGGDSSLHSLCGSKFGTKLRQPTAKYWRVLLNKSYELLDKVHSLLPSDSFISVTRGLMGNEVSNVRRKALELLNHKLQQKTTWDQNQTSLLLSLVPPLLVTVSSSSESFVNRQTALFSLKLLCRSFGSSDPRSFVEVMKTAWASSRRPTRTRTSWQQLCSARVCDRAEVPSAQ
ncbi:hypothetical protein WMY93_034401, partial [Mugilogobius chulae]